MLKLVKRLGVALAVVIAVFAVVVCVAYGLGVKPYRAYIIHTGSMAPTIPIGSAVIVHTDHYHVGQVISFTVDGQTFTHRLLGFDNNGLTITKGDADSTVDPWHVPKDNIIGGVVMAPPYLGWGLAYLFQSKTGAINVLLWILLFWLCLMYATEVDKSAESDRTKSSLLRDDCQTAVALSRFPL
ncbi:MAG: signal peptidase I [Candidatus Saccharibacteria bacterium]